MCERGRSGEEEGGRGGGRVVEEEEVEVKSEEWKKGDID